MAILITDTETREILRRVKEISFAFGEIGPSYTLCEQIDEFMQSLLDSEKERIVYRGRAPQAQRSMRHSLVSYIMKIAELERLSSATVFAAIYLFDRFFDVHSIADKQIHLVAISCLIISGKLEEKDTRTPKIKRLQSYIPESSDFTYRLFGMIERFVLHFFDFRVLVPTEISFLEFFMIFAMDGSEIGDNENESGNNNSNNNNNYTVLSHFAERPMTRLSIKSTHILKSIQAQSTMSPINKTTLVKIHNCAMHVLQTLLKYEPSVDFPPSLITSAVLLYARREMGLNYWTDRLTSVTTYSIREVVTCLRYHVEPVMYPPHKSRPNLPDPSYVCSDHKFTLEDYK